MDENNLCLRSGVYVEVAVPNPTGPSSRNPCVLLNNSNHLLDRSTLTDFDQSCTFDTYDGQNLAQGLDWYAIHWPQPQTLNCIELTMGFPYRDGGWWTTLSVEFLENNQWNPVTGLDITPHYNFTDSRNGRLPFETYALTFERVHSSAVRLIGRAGGIAQFTSLARLGCYHRELSRWNPSELPAPPVPYIFRLISPRSVWDMSESLIKLTNLAIGFPFMEYYLDEGRYQQHWKRLRRNYEGEPELWFLIGNTIGWDRWNCESEDARNQEKKTYRPYIRLRLNNTLAMAVAPIVIEDRMLAELKTHPVILRGAFDPEWHRDFARRYSIPWQTYINAFERSPQMTREQLEGAAELIGMTANTIVNLVYRLDGLQSPSDQRVNQRRELVRRAISFMEENLEESIDVKEVASAVALSPAYFSKIFTEETGRNPSEFLIFLRIERAREYLTHTNMSVTDVCIALGYNRSHFSRLFKRETGQSPAEYAKVKHQNR
jgi:AraC-like DNA-binding protein